MKIIGSIKNTVHIHCWDLHCVHSLLHTCTTTNKTFSKHSSTDSRIHISIRNNHIQTKIRNRLRKKKLGIEKTLRNGLGFSAFSLFPISTKKKAFLFIIVINCGEKEQPKLRWDFVVNEPWWKLIEYSLRKIVFWIHCTHRTFLFFSLFQIKVAFFSWTTVCVDSVVRMHISI